MTRPKPIRIRLGPAAGVPWTGMNSQKAGQALGPGELATCTNVDLTNGILRGLYGPGSTVATLSASAKHVRYEDNNGWKDDTNARYHTYDAIAPTGYRFSFYTDPTPGVMRYANGSVTNKWAGLAAPGSAPTEVAEGTGDFRYFRYTYYSDTGSGYQAMESNPSPILTTIAAGTGAQIGVTASGDAAVGGIRIYATAPGTTSPFYLTDEVANSTATRTPSATSTSAAMLDWEVQGVDSNATYIDDHAPAPSPGIISNALHAAYLPGTLLPCSGILFVAISGTSVLQWSEVGYPWYFPYNNGFKCDGAIEAIVTDQATTYVFTRASIYVVTGTDDEGLNFQRIAATLPITAGAGHSAVLTPWGVVYQCDSGLAIFDGHAAQLITEGLLSTSELYGRIFACAWRDNQLLMLSQSDSNGGYVVDFGAWPQLRITKHDVAARALTQATAYSTPGTYVEIYASGAVKQWAPSQRGNVSGATAQIWTATTGKLDGGLPNATKYWSRIQVEASGTVALAVSCYNNAGTQVGSTLTITAAQIAAGNEFWLPGSFVGDYLQVVASSADGTGAVYGLTIEGEAAE